VITALCSVVVFYLEPFFLNAFLVGVLLCMDVLRYWSHCWMAHLL